MKSTTYTLFLALGIVLGGCSTPSFVSQWQSPQSNSNQYKKIMVAAILPYHSDSLRHEIEQNLTDEIARLGYTVVPSSTEFTTAELKDLSEENTYVALCNKGIDAILTVAFIPDSFRKKELPKNEKYPAAFFYREIWKYRDFQQLGKDAKKFQVDAILFDLEMLQPKTALESSKAIDTEIEGWKNKLAVNLVNSLQKQRSLTRVKASPKAF